MNQATDPTVLIYRSRLLPASETFIADHAASLCRFRPVLSGLRPVTGIDLSGRRVVTLEQNRRRPGALAAFKALGHAPRFLAALRAQRPALIHAHFAVDAVDMLPVARALDLPLVVTLHGYDVTRSDRALARMGAEGWCYLARRRRLFREARRLLPVSGVIRAAALRRGAPEARLHLHHLGIPLPPCPPEGPRAASVLFVGRLVEKKGLHRLIPALARALGPEAQLTVIGDGPERARCEALAQQYLPRARFLGTQPRDRVRDEMARARLLCLPSLPAADGDSEGLPIVLLEAGAACLPVVGFDHGGVAEAVRHGDTGLLAAPGDEAALTAALAELLARPGRAARMGRRGRAHVEAHFDIRERARALEALYDEVIAEHARSRAARSPRRPARDRRGAAGTL